MSFPKHFLDELKARIRVSEVVGRKVKLTRRGREFVGLSPFSIQTALAQTGSSGVRR